MKDIADNNIQEDAWSIFCAEAELEKEEIVDDIKLRYNNLTDLDKDENPDIELSLESKKNIKNLKEKLCMKFILQNVMPKKFDLC